jgi:hypothetical protein
MREQRTENDLGAFVDQLLRRLLRARRAAGVVLHQKLDIRIVEFTQRKLGGVAHRLRGHAGIAGRAERQDETDLDLSLPDLAAGLLRRRRLRGEEIAAGDSAAGARHQCQAGGQREGNIERRPQCGDDPAQLNSAHRPFPWH